MTEKNKFVPIKDGDIVSVNVHNCQYTISHAARVIHIPIATGDSWIFEDKYGVYYVSEGCTISRVREQ